MLLVSLDLGGKGTTVHRDWFEPTSWTFLTLKLAGNVETVATNSFVESFVCERKALRSGPKQKAVDVSYIVQ